MTTPTFLRQRWLPAFEDSEPHPYRPTFVPEGRPTTYSLTRKFAIEALKQAAALVERFPELVTDVVKFHPCEGRCGQGVPLNDEYCQSEGSSQSCLIHFEAHGRCTATCPRAALGCETTGEWHFRFEPTPEGDGLRRLLAEWLSLWGETRPEGALGVLWEAYDDIRTLGRAYAAMTTADTRSKRAGIVKDFTPWATEVLAQEAAPVPRLNEDGTVTFVARPATLRAALAVALLRLAPDQPHPPCLYCGQPFERTSRRGAPPKYCPEHRTAACHVAVHEGRAPAVNIAMTVWEDE